MSLGDLRRIVAPPEATGERIDWPAVRERIGVDLPSDYRALVEAYGAGALDGFLWIYSPFADNPYVNVLDEAVRELGALRAIRAGGGTDEVPYQVEDVRQSELLPWGGTDNGDICFWHRVKPDPESWTIAIHESRGPDWFTYDGNATDFLVGVLTRSISCYIFPDDFPDETHSFRPARTSD